MASVVLDADILIGFLDPEDAHHGQAVSCFRTQLDAGSKLFISASVYAEIMVYPLRANTENTVNSLIDEAPIEVVGLDRDIAFSAAKIRAEFNALRLPDAFTVATAQKLKAEVITFDASLQKIAEQVGLEVITTPTSRS